MPFLTRIGKKNKLWLLFLKKVRLYQNFLKTDKNIWKKIVWQKFKNKNNELFSTNIYKSIKYMYWVVIMQYNNLILLQILIKLIKVINIIIK